MSGIRIKREDGKVIIAEPPQYMEPFYNEDKIYDLLIYLHSIMNGKNKDLSRIPKGYELKFHQLVQRGIILILTKFLGQESDTFSVQELQTVDFELFNHHYLGKCYKKVDSEQYFIPFAADQFGLNYGQFLQDYMSKLTPWCLWLLPQARRPSQEIYRKGLVNIDMWFGEDKIGFEYIVNAVLDLKIALGLEKPPIHLNSAKSDPKFTYRKVHCALCPMKFLRVYELIKHNKFKHEGIAYKCPQKRCQNPKFSTIKDLKCHLFSSHREKYSLDFLRKVKDEDFQVYISVEPEIVEIVEDTVKVFHQSTPFQCEECAKFFTSENSLQDHLKSGCQSGSGISAKQDSNKRKFSQIVQDPKPKGESETDKAIARIEIVQNVIRESNTASLAKQVKLTGFWK